jgi:concentrative nucleoside transporter, CNT family
MLISSWWICGLVLHRDKWLIPMLLYIAITLWIAFRYVPATVVTTFSLLSTSSDYRPVSYFLRGCNSCINRICPEKWQIFAGAFIVVAVIFIGTFASPTTADNNYTNRGISIAGLCLFYIILYLTSANRKKIVWRTVVVGLLCQYILALFVLRTQAGYDIFNFISFLAR